MRRPKGGCAPEVVLSRVLLFHLGAVGSYDLPFTIALHKDVCGAVLAADVLAFYGRGFGVQDKGKGGVAVNSDFDVIDFVGGDLYLTFLQELQVFWPGPDLAVWRGEGVLRSDVAAQRLEVPFENCGAHVVFDPGDFLFDGGVFVGRGERRGEARSEGKGGGDG